MKKIDIGLDIGIASVGWAIVESSTMKLIKRGVRLFETVDSPKDSKLENETRREKRSARRQVNRRRTLKRDFIKLLQTDNLIKLDSSKENANRYIEEFTKAYINNGVRQKADRLHNGLGTFKLRQLGLTNPLVIDELIIVLYWYIQHRGYKDITTKDELKIIKPIKEKDNFPVDWQINHFTTHGYLNGSFNRSIKTAEYKKEIEKLFTNQTNVSKKFKQEFIELFERQRDFSIGPGGENTPTPFGRHFMLENGKLIKRKIPYTSIWEKTIGKGLIYKDENRAPKDALSSNIFNLMNDLNNLTINVTGEVLDQSDKLEIIKISTKVKNNTKNKVENNAKKILDYLADKFNMPELKKVSIEENPQDVGKYLSGYRIDKKGAPLFTPLTGYHIIDSHLNDHPLFIKNNCYVENNIYDQIAIIFSKFKMIEQRLEQLKNLEKRGHISGDLVALSEAKISFSDTHSFSLKGQKEFIDIMIRENRKNQMQIINDKGYSTMDEAFDFSEKSYITEAWIDKIITTPTVKRALRQSVKVLNAIINSSKNNDWEIADIVIEMAKDNNNKAKRENITNGQKYREELNDVIRAKYEGYDNFFNRTKNKLWLLEQQQGCDAYDGNTIDPDDVIKNSGAYDIDHIIPFSQVFDNSKNNQVLTKQNINFEKGNKTPFQYLSPSQFAKMKKLWESWYLNSKTRALNDRTKFNFLTTEKDFSKPENQFGFIGRNLVDTRYTTKVLLEALIAFKNEKKMSFKVKTINGKMTSFARRQASNRKNNDNYLLFPKGMERSDKLKDRTWHGHHSEDAYFIIVLNNFYKDGKFIEKILSTPIRYEKLEEFKEKIDVSINANYPKLIDSLKFSAKELNRTIDDVVFSRASFKKNNQKLFNKTLLYSGIVLEGKKEVSKTKYVYLLELKKKDAAKYFSKDDKTAKFRKKVVMFHTHYEIFEQLQNIFENYQNDARPFASAANNERYLKIIDKNGNSHLIQKLKINDSNKKIDEIIIPNINIEDLKVGHKVSFYESMEWVELYVFMDNKNKYRLIPINALNSKFVTDINHNSKLVINIDKLNKQKQKLNISSNTPTFILRKNDLLHSPDGLQYFIVGASANRIEIKRLDRLKISTDPKHKYKSINTLKGWKLAKKVLILDKANKFRVI